MVGWIAPAEAYALKLDPAGFQDVAAVLQAWDDTKHRTEMFLSSLTDADLARMYSFTMPNGYEWSMVLWKALHVANHGTQHRSEVAALLTTF